jgi:ABC-type branched-subunit amino acid transport system substrate-binding protein
MSHGKGRALCAVMVALTMLTAACGGGDDSGGDGDGATSTTRPIETTTTEAAVPTASDVGITADEIKVGFILTDLEQVKPLLGDLGADKEDQQASYQAFVDEVNATGGVNGRTLIPVFTTTDPIADDGATACNKLTEDDEVFGIVSNGLYGPPVLCVTQQHGTPLVNTGGFANEYYEKSAGLLYSMQPTKARSARNAIGALEAAGDLQDKTIGVLTSLAGDDNLAVETALVPSLEQLDHDVAVVSNLSVDTGAAMGQVPVEVTQMREAGVDLVFLSTNAFFSSLFVQTAEEQGYRPAYALSDADDNILDYVVGRMPASFAANAYTAKRIGEQREGSVDEAELDADCRAVVEASTKTTLERGTTKYETAMSACNQVRIFVQGLEGAGVNPTRASWATAMQALGAFPMAYANGGSFSPEKFDAADFIRPVSADMTCLCWMPTGDFEPMRY